ncbi:MAG: NDP-hexose 2,3-dehydratase family protein [Ruminiclostridium sp.]|nr:NDP-hexose 2,3-dehydratase family protein [Ruminiclostridium sp.]
MKIINEILKSSSIIRDIDEITSWVAEKNASLKVKIEKNKLSDSGAWFYDETAGEIRNAGGTFFQIRGLQQYRDGGLVLEQPVLIQDEIGYLGIICKKIDGVLHFLMQAKIEPGNVNKIQISPTIQATKSNFTQKHGGKKPAYLDYFLNAVPESIIVDQIQSEQSSRFLGKRNRNIIIYVDEEIEVLPSHRWLTLGTIKALMKIDNLVNMDTRTVLSCIPYSLEKMTAEELSEAEKLFSDKALFSSMFGENDHADFVRVMRYINNYKMLHSCENKIVPLHKMESWDFNDSGITHKTGYPFKVIFCDIEIEGREVTHWSQPLFEADGMAVFGLITADFDGKRKFLVQAKPEAGCYDSIELAPTVQLEAAIPESEYNAIDRLFFSLMEQGAKIRNNVILSEEGGRFYHEQNRNIVLDVAPRQVGELPAGYFWLDYKTLNQMVQYNNVLNIQLRNLLSLLEI